MGSALGVEFVIGKSIEEKCFVASIVCERSFGSFQTNVFRNDHHNGPFTLLLAGVELVKHNLLHNTYRC